MFRRHVRGYEVFESSRKRWPGASCEAGSSRMRRMLGQVEPALFGSDPIQKSIDSCSDRFRFALVAFGISLAIILERGADILDLFVGQMFDADELTASAFHCPDQFVELRL